MFDNDSSNCTELPASAKDHTAAKALLGVMYSLVLLAAVSGNALVLYVVGKNKHMQTVTNLFIANLAASDVLQNCTSLWLTPIYIYLGRWVWGETCCYLFPLFQGGGVFISTFTLSAIAADRYVVILHPFKPRMRVRVCVAVVVCIWMTSLLLTAPLVANMHYMYHVECGYFVCFEEWPSTLQRKVYGGVVLLLQWCVPFLFIMFCYACVFWRVRRRPNLPGARSVERANIEHRRKQRLNIMLLMMVLIFGFCWLPLNSLNVVRDINQTIFADSYSFTLIYLVAHWMGMSATCWNPLLYAVMNDTFRREFQAVLPCFSSSQHVARSLTTQAGLTAGILSGSAPRAPTRTVADSRSRDTEMRLLPYDDVGHSNYVPNANGNSNEFILHEDTAAVEV